jgi:hypothetical protein
MYYPPEAPTPPPPTDPVENAENTEAVPETVVEDQSATIIDMYI